MCKRGETVTLSVRGKLVSVDRCIRPIVVALNAAGLETIASCCGHGHRPGNIALRDGREIVIPRNYEEGRRIDRLFPLDINGDEWPGPGWPDAVSDGLSLPCHDCGELPRFDYHVRDDFWQRWVPGPERTSVVCLPCLDRRCGGEGLADALEEVQWTGTGHTVVLRPSLRHEYVGPGYPPGGEVPAVE